MIYLLPFQGILAFNGEAGGGGRSFRMIGCRARFTLSGLSGRAQVPVNTPCAPPWPQWKVLNRVHVEVDVDVLLEDLVQPC